VANEQKPPFPESADLRAVKPDEYEDVLGLWRAVWGSDGDAYFRAYLYGDPWHEDRFCRIARCDGKVVAAVHICKRPVRRGTRELWMGGIANVATLPEYRRFGLSAELLRQAVQVMDEEGFDYSALGTGYFGHYAKHGWFQSTHPVYALKLTEEDTLPPADPSVEPLSVSAWLEEAPPVYAAFNSGLPQFFVRSLDYWNGWLRIRYEGWNPERPLLLGLRRDGILEGYLLGALPSEPGRGGEIQEIAALEPAGLTRLIAGAVRTGTTAGASHLTLRLPALPTVLDDISSLGDLETHQDNSTMYRRFRLDEPTMNEMVQEWERGDIVWWGPDGF
jgi:predicted N-acetyltransferase YhbS